MENISISKFTFALEIDAASPFESRFLFNLCLLTSLARYIRELLLVVAVVTVVVILAIVAVVALLVTATLTVVEVVADLVVTAVILYLPVMLLF